MSEELKPCAHCGSDAVNYRPTDDHESQMIECRFCGSAIQDHFASKSELFSMWNKRPSITLDQAKQVLAEEGMVAMPESLDANQRHQIKLQGDYCMQECEEFYDMVLKAAQAKPGANPI